MVGTPRDSALLRVTLANALILEEQTIEAEQQLMQATKMDPAYTAAWKQLGKVRLSLEDKEGARKAWRSGLDAARENGDIQAEKELGVFIRRLDRSL
jgi:Tfp pilus assembly protein PilF